MKVGVISRGSPDYLIDIVCDGLISLLGRHRVALDYVHKSRWGGQYSILMAGVETPNSFDIHDADVLVASDRSIPEMEAWIKRTGKKAVALIDGEDDAHLRYDPSLVNTYFKREFLIGKQYHPKVKPLPFAAIQEPLPKDADIKIPVFYLGHTSHPIRDEVVSALKAEGVAVYSERVSKQDYNNMLTSSLIGISVRGCGWDTYRYWEIPYFGSALLSQRLGIAIPGNFIEDYEAVFFSTIREMVVKLRKLVSDPGATLALARRGHQACLARHTARNRAQTVLETLS